MATAHPYDERWQDPATIDADLAAISEQLDRFEVALRKRDRAEMFKARLLIGSRLEALEEEWKK